MKLSFLISYNKAIKSYILEQTGFVLTENIILKLEVKQRPNKQIKDLKNAFLALDGITFGLRNEIPLAVLGFILISFVSLCSLKIEMLDF